MKLQYPIMTRIKTKLFESGSPFTPVMNTKLETGRRIRNTLVDIVQCPKVAAS